MKTKRAIFIYDLIGKSLLGVAGGGIGFMLCAKAPIVAIGIGLGLALGHLLSIDFIMGKSRKKGICNTFE